MNRSFESLIKYKRINWTVNADTSIDTQMSFDFVALKNFLSKNETTVGACKKKFKCYDRNYFKLGFEWMYKFTWGEESGLFLMIFSPWGPIFLTQPSTNKIKCILHGKQYLKCLTVLCSVAEPVLSLIFRGRSRIFGSTPARTLD